MTLEKWIWMWTERDIILCRRRNNEEKRNSNKNIFSTKKKLVPSALPNRDHHCLTLRFLTFTF